ncbi:DUF397 domain-containing protein [Streptomyces sp. ME01-24h]|nr:DUF397 domain-containing protein [Streptomyces sp. ME19-03-3]MDX3357051.1 DUF397 domain-containing protein [Streptomyces sp. ME01-24h]
MERIGNVPAREPGGEDRRKRWGGGSGGACAEVLTTDDGRVASRRSADPDGPCLIRTRAETTPFIQGAEAGRADFPPP